MGELSLGGTGELHLPPVTAAHGTGRSSSAAEKPEVPAWQSDRAAAHGLGEGGFEPGQINFSAALKQAVHAAGIQLLERLLETEPQGWPALLEKATPLERQQAMDFLAGHKTGARHDLMIDGIMQMVANMAMVGPDAHQSFQEAMNDLDKHLQELENRASG